MAINNPMSTTPNDPFGGLFLGAKTQYNPTEYNKYQYQGMGGYDYKDPNSAQAQGALSQMMTGKLSDSSQALLGQQFNQNLAGIRQGAYGMPSGAQAGLEMKQAGQNALSAAQLGESQRNFAIQQNLGYQNSNQQNQQYGYGQAANQNYLMNQNNSAQNTAAQNWDQQQRMLMANNTSQTSGLLGNALGKLAGGVMGNVVGAGISGISGLLGIGGPVGGAGSSQGSPSLGVQAPQFSGMNGMIGLESPQINQFDPYSQYNAGSSIGGQPQMPGLSPFLGGQSIYSGGYFGDNNNNNGGRPNWAMNNPGVQGSMLGGS